MIRSTLLLAVSALGFSALDTSAAEVQVAYTGVVTEVTGPQASLFAVGQVARFHYVVETTTPDTNASTADGSYFGALRELQVVVAEAGVSVLSGMGSIQTTNHADTDRVLFYSFSSSAELAGLPVVSTMLSFSDYQYENEPVMLVSDELPTTHLSPENNRNNFIHIGTSAGTTSLRFEAVPDAPDATCASEGYTGTKLAWCQNICEKDYRGKTLDSWIHRWVSRYRDLPYCVAGN